jgi:hypothetical protein
MSGEELRQLYMNGALLFARSFMWKHRIWSDEETMDAMADLDLWFRSKRDKEAAFINFCERVVIAGVLAGMCYTTPKALWNCLVSARGLATNKDFRTSSQRIASFRRKNDFLTIGLPVLCKHYIHYLNQPSHKTIQSLADTLDTLGFPDLMELFYDLINGPQTV